MILLGLILTVIGAVFLALSVMDYANLRHDSEVVVFAEILISVVIVTLGVILYGKR